MRRKPESFDTLLGELQRAGYEIKIGANIVFTRPGQKQNIRMKSLGEDYSEDALRAVIAGTKIHNPQKKRRTKAKTQRPSLLSEIETKIHAGRGAAYDQTMKVIRLKRSRQAKNIPLFFTFVRKGGFSLDILWTGLATITKNEE